MGADTLLINQKTANFAIFGKTAMSDVYVAKRIVTTCCQRKQSR